MKTVIFIYALLLTVSSDTVQFDKFYSLSGTWRMPTKKGALLESWKKVNANEMYSESMKVAGNDTIPLEKVRLVKNAEGVFYIPIVADQNNNQPVSFKLVSFKGNRFVFENKTHDFPNRIIYDLVSSDSLVARIEGDKDGKVKGMDYFYKRVK